MLLEQHIKYNKPTFLKVDYGKLLGLEEVTIEGKTNILAYTDGEKLYKINVYGFGKEQGVRTCIDDYIVIFNEYKVVAIPFFQKTGNDKLEEKTSNATKTDIYCGTEAQYKRLKNTIKKHQNELKPVTFEYLKSKGIKTDIDGIKWELRPLPTDIVTGRTPYQIVSISSSGIIRPLYRRKLPLKVWKEVSKYMDLYLEPNDNYDPMGEVAKGTYYTFNKKLVEEILNKYQ